MICVQQSAVTRIDRIIRRLAFLTIDGGVIWFVLILLKTARSLFSLIYSTPKPTYAKPCHNHGYWSGFG